MQTSSDKYSNAWNNDSPVIAKIRLIGIGGNDYSKTTCTSSRKTRFHLKYFVLMAANGSITI